MFGFSYIAAQLAQCMKHDSYTAQYISGLSIYPTASVGKTKPTVLAGKSSGFLVYTQQVIPVDLMEDNKQEDTLALHGKEHTMVENERGPS